MLMWGVLKNDKRRHIKLNTTYGLLQFAVSGGRMHHQWLEPCCTLKKYSFKLDRMKGNRRPNRSSKIIKKLTTLTLHVPSDHLIFSPERTVISSLTVEWMTTKSAKSIHRLQSTFWFMFLNAEIVRMRKGSYGEECAHVRSTPANLSKSFA